MSHSESLLPVPGIVPGRRGAPPFLRLAPLLPRIHPARTPLKPEVSL